MADPPVRGTLEQAHVVRRRVARPQNTNPPFSARTDTADCAAKRIRASVSVEAEGEEFDRALLNFLTVARRNICNFERPSMRAFAGRGWRYTYTFTAANGELRRAEVEC